MKIVKRENIMQANRGDNSLRLLVSGKEHGAKDCQSGVLTLAPGQSMPELGYSQHPSEEIFYILSGKVRVKTDTDEQTIRAGDMVFMPNNKLHAVTNISQEEVKTIWFVTPHTVPEK